MQSIAFETALDSSLLSLFPVALWPQSPFFCFSISLSHWALMCRKQCILYSPVMAFEVKFKSETWLLWDSRKFSVSICLYWVVKRLWFIYLFNLQILTPNKSDKKNELWKEIFGSVTKSPGCFPSTSGLCGDQGLMGTDVFWVSWWPWGWEQGPGEETDGAAQSWVWFLGAQGRRAIQLSRFLLPSPTGSEMLKCEIKSSRLSTSPRWVLTQGENPDLVTNTLVWIYFLSLVAGNVVESIKEFVSESEAAPLFLQIKPYWIAAMPVG